MVLMLQAEDMKLWLDNDLFDGCVLGNQSNCSDIPNIPYVRKDIRDVELSDLQNASS